MPKSAAERMREYRERKRNLLQPIIENYTLPESDSPSTSSTASSTSSESNSTAMSDFDSDHSDGNMLSNEFVNDSECNICDKLFSKNDLKLLDSAQKPVLWKAFPGIDLTDMMACWSCRKFLNRRVSHTVSETNSFGLWRYMLWKMLFFPKSSINCNIDI